MFIKVINLTTSFYIFRATLTYNRRRAGALLLNVVPSFLSLSKLLFY